MASTAFTDDFTSNHGGLCFFVDVSEAATVLARSRPEGDRAAFIQDLVDQATTALPPAPEPTQRDHDDDDDDDDEPAKAQDTPESRSAKRQVVAHLVQALDGHRLEASSDKEFEGLANLVLALVLSHYTPADTEYNSLLSTLADALTTTTTTTSSPSSSTPAKASAAPSLAARYASLATLFNALPTEGAADLRLSLLLKLVAFAAANDDLSVVAPALAKLEHWLAEWNLGADKSDAAVRDVVAHLVAHGHAKQARELLASHLAASKDHQSSVAPELAATLVALSLAAPDVYDFHALTPARVPALASLPSSLSTLLSRFQASSSSSSPSYPSNIPQDALEAVPGVPLSKAQLEHKLRLVQLADLCAERVGQTVSYDEIAKACGVEAQKGSEEESEEVEGWVIDAIRASLLLGRLSQPSRTLSVSRASPVQAFTPQHWATVQQRLEGWKVSLGRVRASVDRALGVSSGAGAAEVVGDRRRGGEQQHDDEQ
ncbi:hypothetical protein JCM3775_000380 [Rhodotorula graminis]